MPPHIEFTQLVGDGLRPKLHTDRQPVIANGMKVLRSSQGRRIALMCQMDKPLDRKTTTLGAVKQIPMPGHAMGDKGDRPSI